MTELEGCQVLTLRCPTGVHRSLMPLVGRVTELICCLTRLQPWACQTRCLRPSATDGPLMFSEIDLVFCSGTPEVVLNQNILQNLDTQRYNNCSDTNSISRIERLHVFDVTREAGWLRSCRLASQHFKGCRFK